MPIPSCGVHTIWCCLVQMSDGHSDPQSDGVAGVDVPVGSILRLRQIARDEWKMLKQQGWWWWWWLCEVATRVVVMEPGWP